MRISYIGFWLSFLLPCTLHGWSWQHDDATRLAAMISPEPFNSNFKTCTFGSYPDSLPDHATGLSEELYLRRLFTFEAIDALRAGDAPKAMFLASAPTHFLTDYSCIAHMRAWHHNGSPHDKWAKYLPRKYQSLRVPRVKKDVYYEHLKGTYHDTCLDVPEPQYNLEKWRQYQGSINAYFDSLPSVYALVTPEMLRPPVDWTCTDFDQYARWYGNFIALDMLDPHTLDGPQIRLRDPLGMKAVSIVELINGAEQCAAYFWYLCTAAKAEVRPSLNEILPEHDKLMALSKGNPLVVISADSTWPVERAAHVLAMELLNADRRLAKTTGRPHPAKTVSDYVSRLTSERTSEALKGHNAILLLTPEAQALADAIKASEIPKDKSGLIYAEKSGENIRIILRGATRQDTLYLVDYLLDLCDAPLYNLWPSERMIEAIRQIWGGWQLLLDLRKLQGEAAVAYARKFPNTWQRPSSQTLNKVREELKRQTQTTLTQEEWWRHFLLELPLPDGRRVPDMIEKGTDYSQLIQRLTGKD